MKGTYKQHIQNKILNIQNIEFWPCDAAGKKCRWKMANTVDTNLFFLGTCDQKTFVCDLTYGWKTSAADLFIDVGKAADRSYRIPYPPFPPDKEKRDCFKPASFFLVLFIPLVTLHFGLSEYWQWECSWFTWNKLMHHSCQLGMILDKMYGIDEKGISVTFLWRMVGLI